MRYFKILLVLLFIYSGHSLIGQTVTPTIQTLKKLFKESTEKYSLTNQWLTCNEEKNYYQRDTIRLYNHINYYYHSGNCCHFFEWHFINDNIFSTTNSSMCEEPPTASIIDNIYKVIFTQVEKNILLSIYEKEILIDRFQVIQLNKQELWHKGDKSFVLTLLRLRTTK